MTNVRQIGDIPFLQISVMYVELIPQLFEGRFRAEHHSSHVRATGFAVPIVESGRGAVVKSISIVEQNRI